MNQKWITMYLDFAERLASESHAVRLKVGAVFVSPDGVMSTGINGLPAGSDNECEEKEYYSGKQGISDYQYDDDYPYEDDVGPYKLVTRDVVSHAEENLFSKLMLQAVSTKGGRIFLTHSPCIHCAKIIVGSGVTHVHYKSDFRSNAGKDWLIANNISCIKEE